MPHNNAAEIESELANLSQMVDEGTERLCGTMQELIRLVRPEVHQRLANSCGNGFMEPFSFLHFSAGFRREGLEPILCGYFPESEFPLTVIAMSNPTGVVYLPRLGYVFTPFISRPVEIRVEKHSFHWTCCAENVSLKCDVRRPAHIHGTSIELLLHYVPLLRYCCPDAFGPTTFHSSAETDRESLAMALQYLKTDWPALFAVFDRVLKRVVIFRDHQLNSFATPVAPGTVFLNSALGTSKIFFLDDLAHQGGHVLLSIASADGGEFLKISGSAPLAELLDDPNDPRTLYVALHGLFTEVLIARCLDLALTFDNLDQDHKREAIGRLAFILRKFFVDRRVFLEQDVVTTRGRTFVNALFNTCEEIAARRVDQLSAANLAGQEYNFCLSTYLKNCHE